VIFATETRLAVARAQVPWGGSRGGVGVAGAMLPAPLTLGHDLLLGMPDVTLELFRDGLPQDRLLVSLGKATERSSRVLSPPKLHRGLASGSATACGRPNLGGAARFPAFHFHP
jgi:hypothetical protein